MSQPIITPPVSATASPAMPLMPVGFPLSNVAGSGLLSPSAALDAAANDASRAQDATVANVVKGKATAISESNAATGDSSQTRRLI